MNISDLQYIESVDASEVQGAGKYKDYDKHKKSYKKPYYSKKASAKADGYSFASGDKSFAKTDTYAFADSDIGISEAASKSVAGAKSYH